MTQPFSAPFAPSLLRRARETALRGGMRAALWLARTVDAVRSRARGDGEPRPGGAGVRDELDPLHPDALADPYPLYARLRAEAPVHRVPGAGYVCVSRYEDVRAVALDPVTYSSNLVAILMHSAGGARSISMPSFGAGPVDVLALADPPTHTAQRKLMTGAFSMRAQRARDDELREMVGECIDGLVAKRGGDYMHELAEVLPMRMVLRLTGLDERDHRRVKAMCDHAVALLGGVHTADGFAEHADGAIALYGYVTRQLEKARGQPTDSELLSAITSSNLSFAEGASILLQLLIAGSDSSASAMGSAMHRLATDAALQASLRASPALIPAFVEEVLRLEAPFQGHYRITTRDVTLGGVDLPRGTRLMLLWASANRDPARFASPDTLDLARDDARQHLTFGHGIHLCIGAHLARREIAIATEEMLRRTSSITLGEGTSAHRPSVFTRTRAHLPIRVEPADASPDRRG